MTAAPHLWSGMTAYLKMRYRERYKRDVGILWPGMTGCLNMD